MLFPPTQILPSLNLTALSGVTGSISIACWIVVFTPQILQNFRRGSGDGLSLVFLVIWLLGDLFNIVGAVVQGVLPTMIILAAYYTLADIVLLGQCLYYQRRNSNSTSTLGESEEGEEDPLFAAKDDEDDELHLLTAAPQQALWKSVLVNTLAVLVVVLAGVLGYLLSPSTPSSPPHGHISFSPLGQASGYLCAFLYLASRIPQILLNHQRRSCEGVSVLFFMFAVIGNATYVLSILANVDGGGEDGRDYGRYVAVNASWLLGSAGTLLLDLVIFAQFWWYKENGEGLAGIVEEEDEEEEDV
ncbi:PQ loop repeat-domain-containing protein [Tricharina praecox]|uniref:PQ loop repeat-domain-containing protein n=1 Tax=Tricharina praecox TaxID=43433 RepID=UPI002220D6F4|nr:PQ loop repeat-domain-containing protein [Tricharina praecox]KAI5844174.1 PQ loop repeat-domain-containing protein [Tricharina praecox]